MRPAQKKATTLVPLIGTAAAEPKQNVFAPQKPTFFHVQKGVNTVQKLCYSPDQRFLDLLTALLTAFLLGFTACLLTALLTAFLLGFTACLLTALLLDVLPALVAVDTTPCLAGGKLERM